MLRGSRMFKPGLEIFLVIHSLPGILCQEHGFHLFFNMMQFESREVMAQDWPASGWKAFCLLQNALKWWGLFLRPAHWRQTESSVTLLIKNPCGDNLQLLHPVRIAVIGTGAKSANSVDQRIILLPIYVWRTLFYLFSFFLLFYIYPGQKFKPHMIYLKYLIFWEERSCMLSMHEIS